MTAEELIKMAAACKTCGKEHQYLRISENLSSWASRDDGHSYVPVLDVSDVAMLRYLVTGHYENPWKPKDPPSRGRRHKAVT